MPRPTADTGFAAGETGRSGVSGAAARTLLAAVARQAAGRRHIGGQRCPNLIQTMQTMQTNFQAKIPTFETR